MPFPASRLDSKSPDYNPGADAASRIRYVEPFTGVNHLPTGSAYMGHILFEEEILNSIAPEATVQDQNLEADKLEA